MATYEYQARTQEGNVQAGSVEAPTQEAAVDMLQRHGLVIIAIQSSQTEAVFERRIKIFDRVTGKDLAIFFRQLATLFKASVPLVSSLEALSEQTNSQRLAEATMDVAAKVDGGMPLDKAMAAHEDVFNIFSIQLVKAGQESGNLDEVLLYLADYSERDYRIKSKIKSAMTYPAFVMTIFLFVGVAMLVWVVPNLLSVIADAGAEPPLITQIIAGLSDFLREKWFIALGAIGLTAFFIYRFLKSDLGKRLWDDWQLRLPVVGKIFRNIYLFRFAESLSLLVKGGVSIDTSLKITADVMDNRIYKQIVNEAREKVNKGEKISEVLKKYPQMEGLVTSMVAVGERTGTLESVLTISSEFYAEEVSTSIESLSSLIEPILIVVMGVGVGLLIAGVLLPIYTAITAL